MLKKIRRRLIIWLSQSTVITFSGFSIASNNGTYVKLP